MAGLLNKPVPGVVFEFVGRRTAHSAKYTLHVHVGVYGFGGIVQLNYVRFRLA